MARQGAPRGTRTGVGAAAAVAALLVLAPGPRLRAARATVPAAAPTFTRPLAVDHPFFPVVPGSVKVYSGRDDRAETTIVETHLPETREFEWGGSTVSCRIVEALKFRAGRLVERERRYFAQADDGSVYAWGDTEEGEDDDEDEDESGGWVVGRRAESDPGGVLEVAAPALFMPATPAEADLWEPEEAAPLIRTSYLAREIGARVRVPAGRYGGCLRVRETDLSDGQRRTIWFAPGTGVVKSRGPGERLRLQAGAIRPR